MIYSFGDNQHGQLGTVLSKSANTCTPQLIQEDEIFEQLFTISLSNISAARSSSNKLYIWGAIRDKDAHNDQIGNGPDRKPVNENKLQNIAKYTLRRPRRTYITSPVKLFAVHEPMFLTSSEPLKCDGLRKYSYSS